MEKSWKCENENKLASPGAHSEVMLVYCCCMTYTRELKGNVSNWEEKTTN